jgi:hypothetical protein
MIPSLLAIPLFFGLGIPIIFLLAGALAKKLVRGGRGWEQADFFLGIEATLAAMSSGLVNIFDLVREATLVSRGIDNLRLAATGGFLTINFILLLALLSIHQDWQLPRLPKAPVVLARVSLQCSGSRLNGWPHSGHQRTIIKEVNVSPSIAAATRKLQLRSVAVGSLALTAALIALAAAFVLTESSHLIEISVAGASSLLAASAALSLQLSKSTFERRLMTSVITASSPMNVAPEATRAIGSLEATSQIEVLQFLQHLSDHPTEVMHASESVPDLPNVFQSRIGPNYRILWKFEGRFPEKITILKLLRLPSSPVFIA